MQGYINVLSDTNGRGGGVSRIPIENFSGREKGEVLPRAFFLQKITWKYFFLI